MTTSATPAFAGLKVMDISQGIAGPYCAEILLQNGASVIKVEPPAGDWGRGMGFGSGGLTGIAVANNIGKRSICIDGNTEAGRALMLRLAREADVVIENFRPGVMDRLGLSYATLSAGNPSLVYVSVSGFGQDGPYVDRPGSDSVFQALSGLMVANRDERGAPRKVGVLVVDVITAVFAAQATSAALYRRATTGRGEHVQLSLLESVAALQANSIADATLGHGQAPRPVTVPAGTFQTADGWINVSSLHDRMFVGLCRALGTEAWLTDPRYASSAARVENAASIDQAMREILRKQPSAHWLAVLTQQSVVCAPVSDYPEFLRDPQVLHGKVFEHIRHGDGEPVPVPRVPGTDRDATREPAPHLGRDTLAVLRELGLAEDEIRSLLESGAAIAA